MGRASTSTTRTTTCCFSNVTASDNHYKQRKSRDRFVGEFGQYPFFFLFFFGKKIVFLWKKTNVEAYPDDMLSGQLVVVATNC